MDVKFSFLLEAVMFYNIVSTHFIPLNHFRGEKERKRKKKLNNQGQTMKNVNFPLLSSSHPSPNLQFYCLLL
jgi:hypothetical protein